MQKTIFLLLFLVIAGNVKLNAQKIKEIYTQGGASGGAFAFDYILLSDFASNQSVGGKSLHIRGSGTGWTKIILTGTADASGRYLVWSEPNCTGAPYMPQLCASFVMSNSSPGQIALMNNTADIATGTCPSGADVLDLVGFKGTGAASPVCFEMNFFATPTSNNGLETRYRFQETNNNSVDFMIQAPLLPVELIYFNVKKQSEGVTLTWATAIEKDNAYFSIERSADGLTYQTIGKVDGFGNSLERRNYNFVDERPLSGLAYYRLRQVDYDGDFEYSPVVSVLNRNERVLGVYPNPGKEWFTLSGLTPDMPLQVRVFDLMGRVVYEQNSVEGSNTLRLDLGNLEDGAYLIQVSGDEGYQQHLRIVKE